MASTPAVRAKGGATVENQIGVSMLNRLISGRWSGWAWTGFGARSSDNFHVHASSSLASRTHPTQTGTRAIDRARSHYLSRPSLPVRQHASSRRKHTLSRPNLGSFSPKPRCARQVTQTRRRMPSSSSTSAEAATSGLPTLHRLTVRLLRSKHRLAACETLCIPAKLTVDKLLDTRYARR